MPRNEVSQEQVDKLIHDIGFLQDESEALKYIIDTVPYTKKSASGPSIVERLLFLDHAQHEYYRVVIEDASKSPRPINLNAYSSPEETFVLDEEKAGDVQKVLYKIAKHRAGLLNLVRKIAIIDWERKISNSHNSSNLFDFVSSMVVKEKKVLKEIADLIMEFQKKG